MNGNEYKRTNEMSISHTRLQLLNKKALQMAVPLPIRNIHPYENNRENQKRSSFSFIANKTSTNDISFTSEGNTSAIAPVVSSMRKQSINKSEVTEIKDDSNNETKIMLLNNLSPPLESPKSIHDIVGEVDIKVA